jgi:DNA-binding response OmpR family regulator
VRESLKALVADDDLDLLDLLNYALRREGYSVVSAIDGEQALRGCETEEPDIVLLDVNLPRINGFEVCRRIRLESDTPIIMLTARNGEDDIVNSLGFGADDYITKPFSARQLTARMQAVLRRARRHSLVQPISVLQVNDLKLDLQSCEATRGEEVIQLTPLEFRILYILAMNAGRVIPYARIVEYAWGYYGDYSSRDSSLLKSHISHIRFKLKLGSGKKDGIHAVPGVGYSLGRESAASPTVVAADLSA